MPLKITVKTLDSSNFEFADIADDTLVKDFKAQIAGTVNISPDSQRLIFRGRVLQDGKKLQDYEVDGKVVHLVQRAPPVEGTDNLAGAEARARSPAPQRVHRHIHVHHVPPAGANAAAIMGQPSPRARLNVANEMLRKAKLVLDRLDNPNQPPPTTSSSEGRDSPTTTSASNTFGSLPSQLTSGNAASAPRTSGLAPQFGMIPQGIPIGAIQISGSTEGAESPAAMHAGIAQAISNAVHQAISGSMGVGGGTAQGQAQPPISMSMRLDSFNISGGPEVTVETTSHASSSTTSSTQTSSTGPTSQPLGPPRVPPPAIEYPPPSAMADTMDEYRTVSERFNMHWSRLTEILRTDPANGEENSDEVARNRQRLFDWSTMVMHYLSHAQHALSDMMINYSRPAPRVLRARPILLQSVTPTVVEQRVLVPVNGNRSTSASSTVTQTASSTSSAPNSAPNPRTRAGGIPSPAIPVENEVEVNIPMIVGIEIGGEVEPSASPTQSSTATSATAAAAATPVSNSSLNQPTASNPSGPGFVRYSTENRFLQNMIRSALGSLDGNIGNVSVEISTNDPNFSVSGRQGSAVAFANPAATTGGGQTQPTTSTRTRTSPQIHHGPFPGATFPPGVGAGGIPIGNVHSFDPFLPCNSHHTGVAPMQQRRTVVARRQRSSSVPPRRNASASTREGGESNSSQATTPSQRISPSHVTWDTRQGAAQGASNIPFGLDPGLVNLVQQLGGAQGGPQSEATARDNNNMINMLQGIFSQIMGAIGGNQESMRISEFLANLPEYNYEEGESLLTDLLMTLARNLTFRDMLQIVMGSFNSFQQLRVPLRSFTLRKVLNMNSMDGITDVEVAVSFAEFVDRLFPELDSLQSVVNVRDGIDFPETLHSFISKRCLDLVRCILNSTDDTFCRDFPPLMKKICAELVVLCQHCFSDDQASLERLLQNRLDVISEDVGPMVRDWTMSTAMGHLRNYIAGIDVSNEVIQDYVVSTEQGVGRRRERESKMAAVPTEDEQFTTPRSSPEPMETDVAATNSSTISTAEGASAIGETENMKNQSNIPIPEPSPIVQTFPSSLLMSSVSERDMVIGTQNWHRAVPSEWVPVIAGDVQAQIRAGNVESSPFSDAYLSTQPAKRRKVAAESKPASGPIENAIRDSLENAVSATGVQPVTGWKEMASEVAKSGAVTGVMRGETVNTLRMKVKKNSDFDPSKFPESDKI